MVENHVLLIRQFIQKYKSESGRVRIQTQVLKCTNNFQKQAHTCLVILQYKKAVLFSNVLWLLVVKLELKEVAQLDRFTQPVLLESELQASAI